jgi:hypothetical protein
MFTIHTTAFPFDGERTFVSDSVQRADHLFEVDIATAGADEVPVAAAVAKLQVSAKDSCIGWGV